MITGKPLCALRRYPYPYKAMMSICSDLDETRDESVYLETAGFLNGTKDSQMGTGLGLEVGNTIYFDMPEGQFAYWNSSEKGREAIRTLMRSGHIDCIHSFGDLAADRPSAERALEELERHGCRLKVWVDHAVSPSNFGSDIMKGQGDVPGSPSYHADLTFSHGIRYVWMGRVTSVIGQDVPRRYGGIFDVSNPLASGKTLLKEAAKNAIGEKAGGKYAMHAGNRVLREVTLRDGRNALEFIRCNPHPSGVSVCDTADGLGNVLTPAVLDSLEERGGTCILYTHLGKTRDRRRPLREETVAALRSLAGRVHDGRILVTTTRRLLDYANARRTLRFRASLDGEWTLIHVGETPLDGNDGADGLDGIGFHVDDPDKSRIFLGGVEITNLQRNPPDATGRSSVSIPWLPLKFPEIIGSAGAWS